MLQLGWREAAVVPVPPCRRSQRPKGGASMLVGLEDSGADFEQPGRLWPASVRLGVQLALFGPPNLGRLYVFLAGVGLQRADAEDAVSEFAAGVASADPRSVAAAAGLLAPTREDLKATNAQRLRLDRMIDHFNPECRWATLTAKPLKYIACDAGHAGEHIGVTLVRPSSADVPVTVSVVGSEITVVLSTDRNGELSATAVDVARAVARHTVAQALVKIEVVGNDGGVPVTPMSRCPLILKSSSRLFESFLKRCLARHGGGELRKLGRWWWRHLPMETLAPQGTDGEVLSVQIADPVSSVEETLVGVATDLELIRRRREIEKRMVSCLNRLREDQRRLILKHHRDGVALEVISKELGMPVERAKVYLHRARLVLVRNFILEDSGVLDQLRSEDRELIADYYLRRLSVPKIVAERHSSLNAQQAKLVEAAVRKALALALQRLHTYLFSGGSSAPIEVFHV